ncbi:alcohol dehydrogenase catalytic domain-containing protein [Kitasatospora sp. NPDC093679]|uniref:alcohol dehydrogenase catalytic domain-containing protein n=1 Tax=Kitasatospora sp. NPDC093679 TaxID=3154983 RepID=UPI0034231C88
MRALEYPGPDGAAGAPRTVETAVPRAGPGQVLVRVEAAGLPPADGAPAGVPGTEFAGVVVQLGPGTYGLEVGDEVLGHCPSGACAEYAAADADRVAHRPAALPWAEAALLPVTAAGVRAALDRLGVRRGRTLLVHGAGAAAGRAAVALALRRGAAVVAVAAEREHAALREAGAVPIGYGAQLAERARAAAPQGVDAVLDAVGPGTAPLWPELAGGPDRVASPVPPPGGRTVGAAESAELGELVELWEEGAFRLVPDAVLGLEEAAAHRPPPGGGTLAVVAPRS